VQPHAHIVLRTAEDEIVVIRRVREGRVYYMPPGTEVADDETPGAAAARAALDDLGVVVEVEQTLYAQMFSGVDHFFFLALCHSDVRPARLAAEHDDLELAGEHAGSHGIVLVPRSELLAHDVRPWPLGRRIVRAG